MVDDRFFEAPRGRVGRLGDLSRMSVLHDTHAVLWWLAGNERLFGARPSLRAE